MSNPQQKLSLNINAWMANSSGLSTPQDWQAWADKQNWPENGDIDASAIPAMMRRRMSTLSKLAVQTAVSLLQRNDIDYIVFSSRHGELHRSIKLVSDILAGEEASPMAFSQSVHNTAAGLATIATKQPIPLTSIAAGDNTFQSALLDAWLYLAENPHHKVLLVDFDEPLPPHYQTFETMDYLGFSLGLILSAGEQFSMTAYPAENDTAILPQGLSFLRQFLTGQTQWIIQAPRQNWVWQRQ